MNMHLEHTGQHVHPESQYGREDGSLDACPVAKRRSLGSELDLAVGYSNGNPQV